MSVARSCGTRIKKYIYRYIYGLVRQEKLAAFYRDAAIGLITPLRDGMNLVAKVFILFAVGKGKINHIYKLVQLKSSTCIK